MLVTQKKTYVTAYHIQGLTYLIFACNDFCVNKKITVGANLHCLTSSMIIEIIFPICIGIS